MAVGGSRTLKLSILADIDMGETANPKVTNPDQ